MSTSPIQSTNVIQDLAAAVTRKLDADGDGKLSTTEFSGFLSQFLGALQSNPLQGASSSALTVAAATDQRQVAGTMAGFDPAKLANSGHDTTKYTVGRILQYYPNTPAGLREALPELQQIVPGVKITGSSGDKLDFGSYVDARGTRIGVIDVIQASGLGGRAWQWLPVE
jgi:hypothetical protein